MPLNASDCSLLVSSNNSEVLVVSNTNNLGEVPVVVNCDDAPQLVRAIAPNGQVFERTFPARTDFNSSLHSRWNIFFPQGSFTDTKKVDLTQVSFADPSAAATLQNSELLKRIQRLEQLLAGQTQSQSRIPATKVNPQPQNLQGYYIQLHAFSETQWSKQEISSKVEGINSQLQSESLHLCAGNKIKGDTWTRVLMGPFLNHSLATIRAKNLERDFIIRKEPLCNGQ